MTDENTLEVAASGRGCVERATKTLDGIDASDVVRLELEIEFADDGTDDGTDDSDSGRYQPRKSSKRYKILKGVHERGRPTSADDLVADVDSAVDTISSELSHLRAKGVLSRVETDSNGKYQYVTTYDGKQALQD